VRGALSITTAAANNAVTKSEEDALPAVSLMFNTQDTAEDADRP